MDAKRPRRRQWPTKKSTPKTLVWTILLLVFVFLKCQLKLFYRFTHQLNTGEIHGHHAHLYRQNIDIVQDSLAVSGQVGGAGNVPRHAAAAQPNILLAGISFSDVTVSIAARKFLAQACEYNIHSHILLAERDSARSLDHAFADVTSQTPILPEASPPDCQSFIHLIESPGEDQLLNMTRSFYGASALREDEDAPNNPWNRTNRIARIKRSREYHRQTIRKTLEASADDWKTSAVIVVLDLDLLAYPSISSLIETSREYILSSADPISNDVVPSKRLRHDRKFHAVCSMGLSRRNSKSLGKVYSVYYDTFSTVLLPNSWIHVDRVVPRGSLEGEDLNIAKMDQKEVLHYLAKEGMGQENLYGAYGNNATNGGVKFEPVPVRSCFGGLTLYRADVWLWPECRYDMFRDGAEYLSKHYEQACEHVVFHECLKRTMMKADVAFGREIEIDEFSIAIKPDLKILWHGRSKK
ncbi:hypothetical protein ACHAWF_008991 [Thalassiosira exigua]